MLGAGQLDDVAPARPPTSVQGEVGQNERNPARPLHLPGPAVGRHPPLQVSRFAAPLQR